MGQKKLVRFAEVATFPNVLQYPPDMAGQWARHFSHNHPITLELACGKGEYTVGMARMYPERNFIGADVKGNRIWVGARQALKESLPNVAFLRTQIDQIHSYFSPGEISEIWITFPDPQLRASRDRKRLTHPAFLRRYAQCLRSAGLIHVKTDSPDLYDFTRTVIWLYGLETLIDIPDLAAEPAPSQELLIRTHYEGLNISGSNRIHYLCFRLQGALPTSLDDDLHEWVLAEPIKAQTTPRHRQAVHPEKPKS
ncbi:MAG: tRNA (guanosine(46)-N7)-methyltransferase TrmB [Bacteroidetes bacterium]|nr:tRNA (guanosine(46)-N7)-methyltransferase TrmB [Bacteroidota bacterium]